LYLKPVIPDDKNNYREYLMVFICGDSYQDVYPRDFQFKLYQLLRSLYLMITNMVNTSIPIQKFIQPLNIDISKMLNDELYRKITEKS
jgi:hypothetical protein